MLGSIIHSKKLGFHKFLSASCDQFFRYSRILRTKLFQTSSSKFLEGNVFYSCHENSSTENLICYRSNESTEVELFINVQSEPFNSAFGNTLFDVRLSGIMLWNTKRFKDWIFLELFISSYIVV